VDEFSKGVTFGLFFRKYGTFVIIKCFNRYRIILGGNEKMKHGLILITLLVLMTACSSEDVSQRKVYTTNDLSPQTITLEETETITEKDVIKSNQDIQLINSEKNDSVDKQSSVVIPSQTAEEKEDEIQILSEEPTQSLLEEPKHSLLEEPKQSVVVDKEKTPAEDSIIIDDTEYINLMHEEKFNDWISVAEKYGATLYAIPYSDVFAIVRDGEVLVSMSTGVASASPNHINILFDLMADKGEAAGMIIEGIKHVVQTGESVQLSGPQEFGDDFSIDKQDEWIVVSW
jgi:D-lyxose ketol-isomerase